MLEKARTPGNRNRDPTPARSLEISKVMTYLVKKQPHRRLKGCWPRLRQEVRGCQEGGIKEEGSDRESDRLGHVLLKGVGKSMASLKPEASENKTETMFNSRKNKKKLNNKAKSN